MRENRKSIQSNANALKVNRGKFIEMANKRIEETINPKQEIRKVIQEIKEMKQRHRQRQWAHSEQDFVARNVDQTQTWHLDKDYLRMKKLKQTEARTRLYKKRR